MYKQQIIDLLQKGIKPYVIAERLGCNINTVYRYTPAFKLPEGFKKCCYCHEVLPVDSFNKDRRSPDGFTWTCKECNKIRAKKYRERKKKEKHNENSF